MSTSSANDKTVNKIALCSAIFAGFAYVGYSVVRTAFGKKEKHDDDYSNENRLFFRRLSQTTQTDVLLGNLDISGSGKVMLRSVTVQERIRELNLRARMFADTMLAIQTSGNTPSHRRIVTKSLQASPWCSPRILSPVDVRHILNSRSSENIYLLDNDVEFDTGSPIKRRWARRSYYKKSQNKGNENASNKGQSYENACQEAEQFFKEKDESQLKYTLNLLDISQGKVLTAHEAKCLTALLFTEDEALLEKTLIVIGNLGTFTENQNTLREAGCLVKLPAFITYHNRDVQEAAIVTVGNIILNRENQNELKHVIPTLISLLKQPDITEETSLYILHVLTNIAVLPDHHSMFYSVLPIAYQTIEHTNPALKLQALKLLINLSSNEDMIPSLLAAQAPRRLICLLNSSDEDLLLRVVTLLSNLTRMVNTLQINPTVDLPIEDKAASPETIRYAAIYGVNVEEKWKSKILALMKNHPNEDIREHCKNIYRALTGPSAVK